MKNEQQKITPELERAGSEALTKEISRAMEMMKRLKTVNNVRDANTVGTQGTVSYLLPQPVYLCPTII